MRHLVLAALVAALGGCATVTRGTSQDYVVESTPPGATVTTSNGFYCPATPCTLRIPRKQGFTVDIALDGYVTARETVTSSMSSGGAAGMAGNVLIGGVIGMGVDASSGALNDLSPNPLQVTLVAATPPAPAAAEVAEASAAPATELAAAEPAAAAAPAAAATTP